MSMQSVVNLDLFGNVIQEKEKVVNVSSVPQRSIPVVKPGLYQHPENGSGTVQCVTH